jgi:hypothetical protein
MIVDERCYSESTMTAARFKSRLGAILAALYLLPGAWIIVSSYPCRSPFCDLPAIVYSALPVPFLKVFYMVGGLLNGISWWEAPWPTPGAILAALSLVCNAATIYFVVLLIRTIFKRKVTTQS